MLFNSVEFLFVFLPLVFAGFLVLRSANRNPLPWLALCSLVFYGWWEPRYLALILGSAVFNFGAGQWLAGAAGPGSRRAILFLGVAGNLLLLGYFKYAAMLLETFAYLSGGQVEIPHIVLPLAISFFTLQQIAYLADVFKGMPAETSPLNYLVFVSFFPQLIAGPIVHHRQLVPQVVQVRQLFQRELLPPALALIIIGLFKKVVLADTLALLAVPAFDQLPPGSLGIAGAWLAMVAYTLQLYFDFSGYCDMALGLALLFGVRLPVNFDSPYKAVNVSEFWRRWHITLSYFLRDYIYIPLGGNRAGQGKRLRNLTVTMLVSGLWHGAGWNFVLWGLAHGLFLAINNLWSNAWRSLQPKPAGILGRATSRGLTFACVALAFVLFRSHSVEFAGHYYLSLVSSADPWFSSDYLVALAGSIQFDPLALVADRWGVAATAIALVSTCLAVVFFMPNSLDLSNTGKVGLQRDAAFCADGKLATGFQESLFAWAMLAVMFWASLLSLTSVSPFLYFQF